MADIHFNKNLIHTADVLRTTPAQSTSGELINSWTTAGAITCRLVQRNERIALESLSLQMQDVHRLLCDEDEDVTEEDRIANVTLTADSTSIDTGPFEIHEVLLRGNTGRHHLSLRLEKIT